MDLQFTLQRFALQLKNKPRTVKQVARVFQKMLRNAAKKTTLTTCVS